MPGMQSRLYSLREPPSFEKDPGGNILYRLGELRTFLNNLFDRFEGVEEFRFSGHHPHAVESILGRILLKDAERLICGCEMDIRSNDSIIGNELAIGERVARCKKDLQRLAIKKMAQV